MKPANRMYHHICALCELTYKYGGVNLQRDIGDRQAPASVSLVQRQSDGI